MLAGPQYDAIHFTLLAPRDSVVSIQGLATGWAVRGLNPGGEESVPGYHRTSCAMDSGYFPGVKRSVRVVNHPPLYGAEVKERVEL